VGLRDRWRRRPAGGAPAAGGRGGKVRGLDPLVVTHLESFVGSRRGVEAYVEPATTVTEMTVVLVAADGEWTRRRIPDARSASDLAQRLGIPIYDVHATGYPPRMREWSARQKRGEVSQPTTEDEVLARLEADLNGET
jgi:hypothetical protein